jgi:hypothetical protein
LISSVLLVLAWRRKRRLNRIRIEQWDLEERLADQRRQAEEAERRARLRPILTFPFPDDLPADPGDPKLWN